MRFLVMVRGTKELDAAIAARGIKAVPAEAMRKMGAFNETLIKDGVLLDMGGLQPTAKGVRIVGYTEGKPRVVDGPFAESKELVAGFWILQGRSREEIVQRLLHCPFEQGEEIEIRQLFEAEDLEGIQ